MCLRSGWRDFFKFSVDRVLKNHHFDGVYYDWNVAMYCNNPLHEGKDSSGVSPNNGLGGYALSPTGHWDIDELIDLVEWTRERVGENGIIILHNTLVPMFTTENFANYVVGMEFTYGKISVAMPRPEDLPLEWNSVGARSRAAIGYGTIAREAPRRLHRMFALTGLMTSVTPWPASPESLELYRILKPLGGVEAYQFEDWRNRAVKLDDRNCISAVYSRPGEAYVLLANLDPLAKSVRCRINPDALQNPLASPASAALVSTDTEKALDLKRLLGEGETLSIPGDTVILLRLK
jgi:hypothetical protein